MVIMIFFITAEVIARYVFSSPIGIGYEAVQFMMAFAFAWGIAYTQKHKGHVSVDIIVSRLGARTQAVIDIFVYFISFILLSLISWRLFVRAGTVWANGDGSIGVYGPLGTLPIFPFYYVVALACSALSLAFFADFLTSLNRMVKK